VFVFRDTRGHSLAGGIARLNATLVSFALCFLYLLSFSPSAIGMAVLIGLGTLVMILLDRREDIITTGITTAVVMVVAILHPEESWRQPVLRLADTIIGVAVGVACKWIASFLFYRAIGEEAR
jgi:uncharacterized membrane protein YccC